MTTNRPQSKSKIVASEVNETLEPGRPRRRRVRAAASVPKELLHLAYRDPEHVCERMTLFASERLAEPAREWAQTARAARPGTELREIAEGLGAQSIRIARIQGAVAGTPFYIALVPGYMNYLWQEIRMNLRLAALYGRDPSALHTAAEVLALRGVHPSVQAAEAQLRAVRFAPLPPKVASRRPLRVWVSGIRRLLVFGGFVSPPSGRPHDSLLSWLRDAIGVVAGAGVWVVTWFFPATLMLAMAWGCYTHARRLYRTTADYYSGETTTPLTARGHALESRHLTKHKIAHGAAFSASILLPIAFLIYATRVRDHVGLNLISALGLLVAISLVVVASVYGRR